MFLIILLVISATLTIQLLAIRLAGHYLMQVHTLSVHVTSPCSVLFWHSPPPLRTSYGGQTLPDFAFCC